MSDASEASEYVDYTGTRAEALIAAYHAVPLFDISPTYQMNKADFNRAVMAALDHMEDVAKAQDMPEWESRARQVITAVVQRLESHGDSCVPGCWLDARDRRAIKEAIEFLETKP